MQKLFIRIALSLSKSGRFESTAASLQSSSRNTSVLYGSSASAAKLSAQDVIVAGSERIAKPKAKSKISMTSSKRPSTRKITPSEPPPTFYTKAKDYWCHVPATIDGMLGGYSSLNVPDIEDSNIFLDEFGPSTTAYAIDCGAGIGRVTKQLLIPRFNLVDMVELTQSFLDQTEEYIGAEDMANVGERFCVGLQDFTPPRGRYDLVWIQWVLGHLADITLVSFLKRCARALSPGGVIVVKENVTADASEDPEDPNDDVVFDSSDSSFTRSKFAFLTAFKKAHLKVTGERLQRNFPASLYPVYMFALRPDDSATDGDGDALEEIEKDVF